MTYILQEKGIYSLILELKDDTCITIGSLGRLEFPAGCYSYTGSARGPGGFKRVRRHLEVASGINRTRQWHIDYLLPHTRPSCVIVTCTCQDLECSISNAIGTQTETTAGFGCSDCGCVGHLHRGADLNVLVSLVKEAHKVPGTKIKSMLIFSNYKKTFADAQI